MNDFVSLTCPTCGGKLEITEEIERFACSHCGNEHLVKRGGGIVTIAPVTEQLANIQIGTDKTAAELAIIRIKDDINGLDLKIIKLSEELENSLSLLLFFSGKLKYTLTRMKKIKMSENQTITNNEVISRISLLNKDELKQYVKMFDRKNKRKPKKGFLFLDKIISIANEREMLNEKIEDNLKLIG